MTPSSVLTLITSDRVEHLADRLIAGMSARPLSPFETDVVVVQSQGTARWLRNTIATRTGCAASIEFPFPASFCRELARSLGHDGEGVDPAFTREAMTWRISELLGEGLATESEYAPIRRFVENADTRKQVGLAARIASRFDDYQMYRAAMLLEWEAGAVPAEKHARWQADLWRRLCGGAEPLHLARWFTQAIERIESAAAAPAGLPPRIAVFGVSTLPPVFVRLLRAVGRFVPVSMYVAAPPRATWRGSDAIPSALYRAFGSTSRDLLALCEAGDVVLEEIPQEAPAAAAVSSALATLQADVRQGVARGIDAGQQAPVALTADDASLTLHSCHSPMREVEVLRDQLLSALAADPTLRPHDLLVMVPDVPAYAPLFETVFGVGETGIPRIPFRIADRPMAQESGIAAAMLRMLQLAGSRCTAPEMLALFDVPAVRRAAGFADGEHADVVAWVRDTGIRWGRDGAMRAEQFRVPAFEANSWRGGLDRLLMGYATGPSETLVTGILPHAGHTTGSAAALGAFAHWVTRLFDTLDAWHAPRPLGEWGAALSTAAVEFIVPGDTAEKDAMAALLRCLESLATVESNAGVHRDVELPVVRDWLERLLGDDSKGSGFLTGGMTVCALKPMRAIPFRVIAVLGLSDDAFPRQERRAAFDLLGTDPQTGDPDRREDDRQLFLDTIMAARERLILSYVGRSARNNAPRAVSVVVAELLDVVDRTFVARNAAGDVVPARELITCEHALQPFSARYFAEPPERASYFGEERPDSPLLSSYSAVNAQALGSAAVARRAASEADSDRPATASTLRDTGTPFITTSLELQAQPLLRVSVADLIACFTNPAKFFCDRTLALRLPSEDNPVEECEPLEVGSLVKYKLEDHLLQRQLARVRNPEIERLVAIARGALPPEPLAPLWFDAIDGGIADFLATAGDYEFEEPVMVHVAGDGWVLSGRVDGIHGQGRVQIRPSTVKAKDLMRAWICHLALSAQFGEWETVVIGKNCMKKLGPVPDAEARLADLIDGYRTALAGPLPLFEQASHAFVEQQIKLDKPGTRASASPIDAARGKFTTTKFTPYGDDRDAYLQLCWRGREPLGAEFEAWSQRLWKPVFAAMEAET